MITKIEYSDKYKKDLKKLKRNYEDMKNITKTENLMKQFGSVQDFVEDSFIKTQYDCERKKYDLSGYYGINPNGHSGKLRIIFKINKEENTFYLKGISRDHYEDFKKYRKGK